LKHLIKTFSTVKIETILELFNLRKRKLHVNTPNTVVLNEKQSPIIP
jgi:hypothetical protein